MPGFISCDKTYFRLIFRLDRAERSSAAAIRIDSRVLLGDWKFIPESAAKKAISEDMTLMFGN